MIEFAIYHSNGLPVENVTITPFTFPGGEIDLKLTPDASWSLNAMLHNKHWVATLRGADPEELIQLGLFANLARAHWAEKVSAIVPYLPAARADKGATRGADIYAGIINSYRFDAVAAIDPHSDYITRKINNLVLGDPTVLAVRSIFGKRRVNAVIAPDHGAKDRAFAVAETLGLPLVVAEKKRDQATGRILSLDLPPLDQELTYLVVDDVCDGGGTFRLLAERAGLPREQMMLWVTHGIFSGDVGQLHAHYSDIFTTTSHPGALSGGHAFVTDVTAHLLRKIGVHP